MPTSLPPATYRLPFHGSFSNLLNASALLTPAASNAAPYRTCRYRCHGPFLAGFGQDVCHSPDHTFTHDSAPPPHHHARVVASRDIPHLFLPPPHTSHLPIYRHPVYAGSQLVAANIHGWKQLPNIAIGRAPTHRAFTTHHARLIATRTRHTTCGPAQHPPTRTPAPRHTTYRLTLPALHTLPHTAPPHRAPYRVLPYLPTLPHFTAYTFSPPAPRLTRYSPILRCSLPACAAMPYLAGRAAPIPHRLLPYLPVAPALMRATLPSLHTRSRYNAPAHLPPHTTRHTPARTTYPPLTTHTVVYGLRTLPLPAVPAFPVLVPPLPSTSH